MTASNVEDAAANPRYAIKLELRTDASGYYLPYSYLLQEQECYDEINGIIGIPRMYACSSESDYNVLVLDLLGKDLRELFFEHGEVFSLRTTLLLADQLLCRFRSIHRKGWVHRDVKPANCVMGLGRASNVVHLIDFGISVETCYAVENHKTPVGTMQYASISGHEGGGKSTAPRFSGGTSLTQLGRSKYDDLESLAYMLISFLKCLPWERSSDPADILRMKRLNNASEICKGIPREFAVFLQYCRQRKASQPDYGYLRRLLGKLFRKQKFKHMHLFQRAGGLRRLSRRGSLYDLA